MTENDHYLTQRLTALHISPERNCIKAFDFDNRSLTFQFFTSDRNGNININYLSPDGYIEYYDPSKPKFFFRTRYKNPKNSKNKYFQPPKTEVIPFSTPLIVESFSHKRKIKTLYVTEGEFKAFALDNFQIPCFGIGGIHNFKNKEKDKLHPYIIDFIKACKVENVVLLFDADCLKVEWEEGKDLSLRLSSFCTAVETFNELLKPYDVCLYFSHIVKESESKGIDDLLYNGVSDQKRITEELTTLTEGNQTRKYIITHKITGISPYRIKQIFYLDHVQTFFDHNADVLFEKEFVYKNDTFYIDDKGKLSVSWRGETHNYIRIGCDYYKKVVEQFPNGQREINLKQWNISTIYKDYHNSKEFIKNIKKCDSFTNIPENDPVDYQQLVISEKKGIKSVLYNRYFPISHIPAEGTWENISKLLHHIFDYRNIQGDSMYTFILDYLTILYKYPVKKLPVICLVSRENGTGKTTFLNLLRAIFMENMRILDSERISSKFNGGYAGKLVVAIDESLIMMDKETVKNKIKMITTNPTIPLEEKGMEAREVPNFSKLIMCSNDESNFMRIDTEENRYCIVKVPVIPKTNNDPLLLEKMEKEIPAFLYFLKNRELIYPEKSRLYFDEEVYFTPALQKVIARTEGGLVKNIKEVIREQFFFSKQEKVRLSKKVILELINQNCRYGDPVKIQEYLHDHNYKTSNPSWFKVYFGYEESDYRNVKDRYYEFTREDFLTAEEIDSLQRNEE